MCHIQQATIFLANLGSFYDSIDSHKVLELASTEINLSELSIDVVKNRFLGLLCYERFQIYI